MYKCKSKEGGFGVITKISLSLTTDTKSRIGFLSRRHTQLLRLIGYLPATTSPMTPDQLPDILNGPEAHCRLVV